MTSISSTELNHVIHRYLMESAYNFQFEARINNLPIDGYAIPRAALIKLVQTGLQFKEMEANAENNAGDEDFCFLPTMDLITKDISELQKIVKGKKENPSATEPKDLAKKGNPSTTGPMYLDKRKKENPSATKPNDLAKKGKMYLDKGEKENPSATKPKDLAKGNPSITEPMDLDKGNEGTNSGVKDKATMVPDKEQQGVLIGEGKTCVAKRRMVRLRLRRSN